MVARTKRTGHEINDGEKTQQLLCSTAKKSKWNHKIYTIIYILFENVLFFAVKQAELFELLRHNLRRNVRWNQGWNSTKCELIQLPTPSVTHPKMRRTNNSAWMSSISVDGISSWALTTSPDLNWKIVFQRKWIAFLRKRWQTFSGARSWGFLRQFGRLCWPLPAGSLQIQIKSQNDIYRVRNLLRYLRCESLN